MNTFGNLLRFPIKLNLGNVCRSFTSSITATVSKSPVVSNSKGFLSDTNNQKILHSSFIQKNIHGAQAKTFNAGISLRFMHVLSKQAEGPLNKIYESAYQKTSLTGKVSLHNIICYIVLCFILLIVYIFCNFLLIYMTI